MQKKPLNYLDPIQKKAIDRLQGWVKTKSYRTTYLQMRKAARYRKNVINEIIQTEISYVRDLDLLVSVFVKPLFQNNILQKDEIMKVFINITEIATFNRKFLESLKCSFDQSNPQPYKVVFQKPNVLVPQFQIYFQFCNEFQESCKILEKLKENHAWMDFNKQIRISNVLKGQDLASYLVKPVQRLPKYVLLYKDLLKHTDKTHPDYLNIQKGLELFLSLNDENNKNMEKSMKFMNRLRLQQFEKIFADLEGRLMNDPDRIFCFEETITLLYNKFDQSVVLYVLTDKVIIAERNEDKPKLIKLIELDSLSFLKNQPDSKYFSNLFMLVGKNDNAQFMAEKSDQKKDLYKLLDQLINDLREIERVKTEKLKGGPAKRIYPVQVMVVGTEERAYQSFQKHTVFVTEVSIGKAAIKIFVRYSEVRRLCDQLKSTEFVKQYGILNIKTEFAASNWMTNQKTKVIENRKLQIEGFLQQILQTQIIRERPLLVLNYLSLPEKFYELPDIIFQNESKQPLPTITESVKKFKTIDPLLELEKMGISLQQLKLSSGEVLLANHYEQNSTKVNAQKYLPSKIEQIIDNKPLNRDLIPIEIRLPNESIVRLQVSNDTRAGQIVESIAKIISLKQHLDYRLFLIDKLHNVRLIDDDEVINKIIHEQSDENYVKALLSKVEQMLASASQQIVFQIRKYIYLTVKLEEHDFKSDPVRMELMSYGILDLIREEKFQLSVQDYCLYAALYFHIKYSQYVRNSINQLPMNQIQNLIPPLVYKNTSAAEWVEKTKTIIKMISGRLSQISQENESKINKQSTYPIYTDWVKLSYLILFNSFSINSMAGVSLFYVDTHEETLAWMKKYQRKIFPNIYLGVSYQKLQYFSPSSTKRNDDIGSFNFKQIKSIKSFPMQIIFEFEDYSKDQIVRFNTNQSYEIKILIEFYISLQQFSREFRVDL